jgi:hypothetical protein
MGFRRTSQSPSDPRSAARASRHDPPPGDHGRGHITKRPRRDRKEAMLCVLMKRRPCPYAEGPPGGQPVSGKNGGAAGHGVTGSRARAGRGPLGGDDASEPHPSHSNSSAAIWPKDSAAAGHMPATSGTAARGSCEGLMKHPCALTLQGAARMGLASGRRSYARKRFRCTHDRLRENEYGKRRP